MKTLAVWMNGEHVADWAVGRTGKHLLTYTAAWLDSPQSRPLSLSLPFTATRQIEGAAVENYFDNLLPDSDSVRRQISTRFKTKGASAFALLEAIGRDCVGAVQLLPPGLVPDGTREIVRRLEHREGRVGQLGKKMLLKWIVFFFS